MQWSCINGFAFGSTTHLIRHGNSASEIKCSGQASSNRHSIFVSINQRITHRSALCAMTTCSGFVFESSDASRHTKHESFSSVQAPSTSTSSLPHQPSKGACRKARSPASAWDGRAGCLEAAACLWRAAPGSTARCISTAHHIANCGQILGLTRSALSVPLR
eukprot:2281103-Rhodomonas_salina.5